MHKFKATLLIGLHILHWTSGEFNIALNRVVTTSNNVTGHLATMVNDQDLSTYVQVDTGNKLGTWIQFDLQGTYTLKKMIIWPTNDDDFLLARVFVYLRMTRSTASTPADVSHTYDYPQKGVAHNFIPTDTLQGRYALLRKDASFINEILKIAEVAILTENTEFYVTITGPVDENNYHPIDKSNPVDAIDDNVQTCINVWYQSTSKSWWRADLGDSYQVYGVYINDYRSNIRDHGFYSVYLDPSAYTMQQLCMFFNHSTKIYNSYFLLMCETIVTGRYLTVISYPVAFCEIKVVAVKEEIVYTMPKDNNENTGKISTAITTKTLLPSSPTILFATSYSTIDDCSCNQQKCQLEIKKATSNFETQKIVIGVVVGVLAVILGIILGFVGGSIYQKKKSAKLTESTVNQNTNAILSESAANRITNLKLTESSVNQNIKNENEEHSIYNDINYTPMKQVHAYDTIVV